MPLTDIASLEEYPICSITNEIIQEATWYDSSDAVAKKDEKFSDGKMERAIIKESIRLKSVMRACSQEEVRWVGVYLNLEEQSNTIPTEKEMKIDNVNRELSDVEHEIY